MPTVREKPALLEPVDRRIEEVGEEQRDEHRDQHVLDRAQDQVDPDATSPKVTSFARTYG